MKHSSEDWALYHFYVTWVSDIPPPVTTGEVALYFDAQRPVSQLSTGLSIRNNFASDSPSPTAGFLGTTVLPTCPHPLSCSRHKAFAVSFPSFTSTAAAHTISGRSLATTPAPTRRTWVVPGCLWVSPNFQSWGALDLTWLLWRGEANAHPSTLLSWTTLLMAQTVILELSGVLPMAGDKVCISPLRRLESCCMRGESWVLHPRVEALSGIGAHSPSFSLRNHFCPIVEGLTQGRKSNQDASDWDAKIIFPLCKLDIFLAAL